MSEHDPRVDKALLDRIDADLHQVIALMRISVTALDSKRLYERFNNTYAGNAFFLVRDHLYVAAILAMMRLWDQDPNALSIPTAIRRMYDPRRIEAWEQDRKKHELSWSERTTFAGNPETLDAAREFAARRAQEKAKKVPSDIQGEILAICSLYELVQSSAIQERLKQLRNKALAHSLVMTRLEKKALQENRTIESAKYGDLEVMVSWTSTLVEQLVLLFRFHSVHFSQTDEIWETYSKKFWSSVGVRKPVRQRRAERVRHE